MDAQRSLKGGRRRERSIQHDPGKKMKEEGERVTSMGCEKEAHQYEEKMGKEMYRKQGLRRRNGKKGRERKVEMRTETRYRRTNDECGAFCDMRTGVIQRNNCIQYIDRCNHHPVLWRFCKKVVGLGSRSIRRTLSRASSLEVTASSRASADSIV